jgi:hypothetical protein
MHPKEFFKLKNLRLSNAGRCFVAMPFAAEFDAVHSAIKSVLEADELGFTCYRADELRGAGNIMTDVLRELERAEIVIADLTRRNANVFYELGIAHTVKNLKSVLLISQTTDDIPFDVKTYRCIEYKLGDDGLESLRKTLMETIKEMTPTRKIITLKRGEVWRAPAPVLGNDNSSYRFEFRLIQVPENGALIHLEVFPEVQEQREPIKSEHTLRLERPVKIPRIPRALKLDAVRADSGEATFCICDPHPPRT